jgi:hypothetical protein
VHIPRAALKEIGAGDGSRVRVLYDREACRIGLRACSAGEEKKGIKVSSAGQKGLSPNMARLAMRGVFKAAGWLRAGSKKGQSTMQFSGAFPTYIRQGGESGPPLLVLKLSEEPDGIEDGDRVED